MTREAEPIEPEILPEGGDLLVPVPVKAQELGFTINIPEMVRAVKAMPLPQFTRFCADVLPALKTMEKRLREAGLGRMIETDQRKIPVMTDDGELMGRTIKVETRNEYDIDVARLRHAQELFHEDGHKDVVLVQEVTADQAVVTVSQIKKICDDRGGRGAEEARLAVELRYSRDSLKVEETKSKSDKSVKQRVKAVHDEITTVVEEGNPVL